MGVVLQESTLWCSLPQESNQQSPFSRSMAKTCIYHPGLLFSISYGTNAMMNMIRRRLPKNNASEKTMLFSFLIAKFFFDNFLFQSMDFLVKTCTNLGSNHEMNDGASSKKVIAFSLMNSEAVTTYVVTQNILMVYQLLYERVLALKKKEIETSSKGEDSSKEGLLAQFNGCVISALPWVLPTVISTPYLLGQKLDSGGRDAYFSRKATITSAMYDQVSFFRTLLLSRISEVITFLFKSSIKETQLAQRLFPHGHEEHRIEGVLGGVVQESISAKSPFYLLLLENFCAAVQEITPSAWHFSINNNKIVDNNKIITTSITERNNKIAENNKLKADNNKMPEENSLLTEENNRLTEENNRLKEENNRLTEENGLLQKWMDVLQKCNLLPYRAMLAKSRFKIKNDGDTMEENNKTLEKNNKKIEENKKKLIKNKAIKAIIETNDLIINKNIDFTKDSFLKTFVGYPFLLFLITAGMKRIKKSMKSVVTQHSKLKKCISYFSLFLEQIVENVLFHGIDFSIKKLMHTSLQGVEEEFINGNNVGGILSRSKFFTEMISYEPNVVIRYDSAKNLLWLYRIIFSMKQRNLSFPEVWGWKSVFIKDFLTTILSVGQHSFLSFFDDNVMQSFITIITLQFYRILLQEHTIQKLENIYQTNGLFSLVHNLFTLFSPFVEKLNKVVESQEFKDFKRDCFKNII